MLWFSFQTKGLNRQFFLVLLIDVDCILDYCVSENEYRDVLSLSALAYAALCFKSMLHMKSFSYLSGLCTSFGNVKDGVGWYVQRNAKTMRWTCKLMHTRWTFFWNGEGKWKLTFYVVLANRILQWDVNSYIMGFTLDLILRWSLIPNHFSYRDIWDLHSNIIIEYAMQDTFFR